MNQTVVIFSFLLFFSFPVFGQVELIPNSSVDSLYKVHSEFTNDDYAIYVDLPPDYLNKRNLQYPIVYHFDADFEIETQIRKIDSLQTLGIAPVIMVGIGYWNQEEDYHKYTRRRDFLLRSEVEKDYFQGEAENFWKFMEQELMPFVEQKYAVDTLQRTLCGYSFGGFFTTYLLFQKQVKHFSNIILISPSIWWAENICFQYEEEYALKNNSFPFKIYSCVGNKGDEYWQFDLWRPFWGQIELRNYDDFQLQKEVLDSLEHEEVFTPGLLNGLTYLFPTSFELYLNPTPSILTPLLQPIRVTPRFPKKYLELKN